MKMLEYGCDVMDGGGLSNDAGGRVLDKLKFVEFFVGVQTISFDSFIFPSPQVKCHPGPPTSTFGTTLSVPQPSFHCRTGSQPSSVVGFSESGLEVGG